MSQLSVPTKRCRNTGIYLDYLSPCQPTSDVQNLLLLFSYIGRTRTRKNLIPIFSQIDGPGQEETILLLSFNFLLVNFYLGGLLFIAAIAALYLSSSLTHLYPKVMAAYIHHFLLHYCQSFSTHHATVGDSPQLLKTLTSYTHSTITQYESAE